MTLTFGEWKALYYPEKKCECEQLEIVYKLDISDRKIFYNQCVNCGKSKVIKKPLNHSRIDKKLQPLVVNNNLEQLQVIYSEYRDNEKQKSYESYSNYLSSESWRDKRIKVLQRDKYICQGCFTQKATEVHHLTYENLYDELLFQLISVCHSCHEKIHKKEF